MEGSRMGQVRHGSATTTHAVRAAIQRSQASLSTLSRELGINPKTVAKWRKRATVEDLKTGPKAPHSTTLTQAEEAAVVAFRRHTLLPLDDCLYAVAAVDPASDTVSAGQAEATALQALPDRLLSHGYRRGSDCRRQTLPVRRHRPHE
jgi:transposase-like protein